MIKVEPSIDRFKISLQAILLITNYVFKVTKKFKWPIRNSTEIVRLRTCVQNFITIDPRV